MSMTIYCFPTDRMKHTHRYTLRFEWIPNRASCRDRIIVHCYFVWAKRLLKESDRHKWKDYRETNTPVSPNSVLNAKTFLVGLHLFWYIYNLCNSRIKLVPCVHTKDTLRLFTGNRGFAIKYLMGSELKEISTFQSLTNCTYT